MVPEPLTGVPAPPPPPNNSPIPSESGDIEKSQAQGHIVSPPKTINAAKPVIPQNGDLAAPEQPPIAPVPPLDLPLQTPQPQLSDGNQSATNQPAIDNAGKKMPVWLKIFLFVGIPLLVVIVVVTAALVFQANQPSPIERAYKTCNSHNGLKLEDDGKTLIIDTVGDKDFGGTDLGELNCVLNELDAPARVRTSIDQTRALDGRLSESWDGIIVEWSYHPDSGLQMIIYME